MVGTLGNTDERILLLMAIARSRPPCTFDKIDCSGSNMIWICPPRRSVTAGALPRFPRRLDPPPFDDGPHLSYAIQWFAFAIIAIVFGGIFVRQGGKDAQGGVERRVQEDLESRCHGAGILPWNTARHRGR